MRYRIPLASIGLGLFSLALTILALEVVIRFLPTGENTSWSDRPKRFYFSGESKNSRDYAYERKKPDGVFRIVVVGDSFTFGYGNQFDDSFPKRLERILNLNGQAPPVEVWNFGTPGNAIQHNAKDVQTALRDFSPDLIILEVTLNDPELTPYQQDGKRVRLNSSVRATGLLAHSRLYQLVSSRLAYSASHRNYKRYFQNLFEDESTVKNLQTGIRSIASTCRESKVPVLAVVFPLFTYPIDATYPFLHAHEVIAAQLKENNIPFLDLLDTYRNIPPIRLTADLDRDPHPNEIAHRIAAESLYEWLKARRVLPESSLVKLTSRKRDRFKRVSSDGRSERRRRAARSPRVRDGAKN